MDLERGLLAAACWLAEDEHTEAPGERGAEWLQPGPLGGRNRMETKCVQADLPPPPTAREAREGEGSHAHALLEYSLCFALHLG